MALRKIRGNNVETQTKTTKKSLSQREACLRCPIACGRFSKGDEGESASFEYKCVGDFGPNLGIYDKEVVQEANDLCNKLGLDKNSVSATIAVGIGLAQRGYIKPEELDGTPLEFGSTKGTLEWIRKMAYREGLGAKMAFGSYHFAESYGAPELSMAFKKLKLPTHDLHGSQRQGPQLESKNGGGRDDSGYMISPERLGFPEKFDRTSQEGKTAWCKRFQDLTAVIDAVGLCLFTSFALGLSDYTAIINAVVGCDYSNEEILACGEQILNNEHLLNSRVGYLNYALST